MLKTELITFSKHSIGAKSAELSAKLLEFSLGFTTQQLQMAKLLNPSVPPFLHLLDVGKNSAYTAGLLVGVDQWINKC